MGHMGMAGKTAGAIRNILCAAMIALVATTAGAAGWGHYGISGGVVYYWNDVAKVKFRYMSAAGQWSHYSSFDSKWYALGNHGRPATFIGDGSSHDLGNGFTYKYTYASDLGEFKKGTTNRFAYFYTQARWLNAGNNGGWKNLGAPGLSASFLGDGTSWHDLKNGFTYSYIAASDLAYFKKGGTTYRFGYYYGLTRWVSAGNAGGWQVIGNPGQSASFLGDGIGWHDLKNGFNYSYVTASDVGWFKVGTTGRFGYSYTPGQWMTTGNAGGWQLLGNAGLSASFLGDGTQHKLGNGFWYTYGLSWDLGIWSTSDQSSDMRFIYWYAPGRWQHQGKPTSGWSDLSSTGRSASFVSDGAYHDLGNGWWYTAGAGPTAWWSTNGATSGDVYRYTYNTGQWEHQGAAQHSYGYYFLGKSGRSASFMGVGAYHDLGDGWWYKRGADACGYWSSSGHDGQGITFIYAYRTGQWQHARDEQQAVLGGPEFRFLDEPTGALPLSADFMGDGKRHHIGVRYGGDSWWYLLGKDSYGYWSCNGSDNGDLFRYSYLTGRWEHQGPRYAPVDGFNPIGEGPRDPSFLGDGRGHLLWGGTHRTEFRYESGVGTWMEQAPNSPTLYVPYRRYNYFTGEWHFFNYSTDSWYLRDGPGVGTLRYSNGFDW